MTKNHKKHSGTLHRMVQYNRLEIKISNLKQYFRTFILIIIMSLGLTENLRKIFNVRNNYSKDKNFCECQPSIVVLILCMIQMP